MDLLSLVSLFETRNKHLSGGAIVLKLCHLATHGRHWTPLGVAGLSMSYQLSLDSVLLFFEQETDEFCL